MATIIVYTKSISHQVGSLQVPSHVQPLERTTWKAARAMLHSDGNYPSFFMTLLIVNVIVISAIVIAFPLPSIGERT